MTTVSVPSARARESARRNDGRFGEQRRPGPDQLALTERAEPTAPIRHWGSVDIREGSRSERGFVLESIQRAPGIAIVSTPSFRGIRLSHERNAAIPAPLRTVDGWYEEDAEDYIVGMYFPQALGPAWLTSNAERRPVCEAHV